MRLGGLGREEKSSEYTISPAIGESLIAKALGGTAPGLVASLVGVESSVPKVLMCGARAVLPIAKGLIPERLNRATQSGGWRGIEIRGTEGLPRGRLAVTEIVELRAAKLLAGSREPVEIVERGVAEFETAPGLGECGEREQEQHHKREKDSHGLSVVLSCSVSQWAVAASRPDRVWRAGDRREKPCLVD